MKSVLKVIGTARLAADPELRSLPSGTSVCNMRIAWNNSRKDASGNWADSPAFMDLTVWGAQGEACSRYLSKGRQIVFEARLVLEEWEKDGQKRSKHKLIAEQVEFVGGGDSNGGGNRQSSPDTTAPTDGDPLGTSSQGDPLATTGGGSGLPPASDDSIPF